MSPMQALRRVRAAHLTSAPLPQPNHPRAERRPDWEFRLREKLNAWSTRSFEWGRADCVHFAFDCIEGITGTNYIADIEPYNCERRALEVLAGVDHRGLFQAVETYLGPAEDIGPDVTPFRRGDLVLTMRKVIGAPRRRGPGLGVCVGDTALFIGANGLDAMPVSDCLCGWRV